MKISQVNAALFLALSLGMVAGCASSGGEDEGSDGDGDTAGDGDGDVLTGTGGAGTTGTGGDAGTGTGGDAGTGTGGADAASGGASASSGGASAGTGGATSTIDCSPFSTFEEGEDGFGVYLNDNATEGSLTAPAGGMVGAAAAASTGDGADSSSGSLHYAGSGFTPTVADNGPGGIRLAVDTIEACQDVSGYTGISFWAKGTSDSTTEWGEIPANTVILFAVADILDEGGSEVDYRFTLNATWTLHEVPFADFGLDGFTASTVERIKFMIPGASFDVAIDNVGFY